MQEGVQEEEQQEYCSVLGRCLEREEAEGLLYEVTELEVENVLKSMHKNKTPRKDGFPAELYIKFWPILKGHLTEVVKYCMLNGELSSTMKEL